MDEKKTIVITGASDGVGAEAARLLAATGHRVVVVGRSPEKTRALASAIGTEDLHLADFTRLSEVDALAEELLARYSRIDVLANNAGGLFSGPTMTGDGFEKTFQVNHLAPFRLTYRLKDRLLASQALVTNTSSIGARLFGRLDFDDVQTIRGYRPNRAYGNAKLANTLFAKGLAERFASEGLTAISFHPGNVATSFASDTNSYFKWVYHTALKAALISPAAGGRNVAAFLNPARRERWVSGTYYNEHGKPSRTHKQAYDPTVVAWHWDRSCELLGIRW